MASTSAIFLVLWLFLVSSTSLPSLTLSSSVIDDLNTLHPPPDFNMTIIKNCLRNPSLRYCTNSSPHLDLDLIFKFSIVASHLCNNSRNPNCVESFPKIDLKNRPRAASLYLSFDFFWRYCPLDITSIDLSNSSLHGSFPTSILGCTQIRVLDLSHNRLSGDVRVESFDDLTNLSLLNLSYNRFSEGRISDTRFFEKFDSSCFVQSGLLPDRGRFKIKALFLLICFPVFVILGIGFLGWMCLKRPDCLPRMIRIRKHRFTPAMIKAATNGLSRKNLVARSDGVDVYKGFLRDGCEVRIEVYWGNVSRADCKRFGGECRVLAQLCHENVIGVLGWSDDRSLRAIVRDWTEGESVQEWLSGKGPSWRHRLKVLMGVLEGMCYLEEQWPEVGYDLRTSSVLLSNDHKPLISSFRVGDPNSSSRRSWRLGVFVLELIVNKRARGDELERGEAGLIEHIKRQYPGNVQKLIDQRMQMTETMLEQAKQGIRLGLMCTEQNQPRLYQILSMITQAYQSCVASNRRLHGDRGKGHNKHIQYSR